MSHSVRRFGAGVPARARRRLGGEAFELDRVDQPVRAVALGREPPRAHVAVRGHVVHAETLGRLVQGHPPLCHRPAPPVAGRDGPHVGEVVGHVGEHWPVPLGLLAHERRLVRAVEGGVGRATAEGHRRVGARAASEGRRSRPRAASARGTCPGCPAGTTPHTRSPRTPRGPPRVPATSGRRGGAASRSPCASGRGGSAALRRVACRGAGDRARPPTGRTTGTAGTSASGRPRRDRRLDAGEQLDGGQLALQREERGPVVVVGEEATQGGRKREVGALVERCASARR